MKRYNIDFIRRKAEGALVAQAVPVRDAKLIVDSMLEADICGVNTHGIKMLVPYLQKIEKQSFDALGGGYKCYQTIPFIHGY